MQTPRPSDQDPTGTTSTPGRMILRRFRVERILGHGGMGEVLLAHDTLLNRRVALKRLRSDGEEGARRRSAVLREARRASQINDRRIAAIHDVVELDDDVLIVMEYVEGSTLRERMTRPIALEEFWDLSTQCVEAVAAAHAHGVIHRDIKPENLMVTAEGLVKILDFGIARRAEADDASRAMPSTTTTTEASAHAIAGTPQYMAPEAHYGGRIDRRTDIFSLGAVFYELLAARQPFAGATYDAILDRIMNVTPAPVSESNAAVGRALSDVIARMLARDPADRYASCAELAEALAEARRTDAPSGIGTQATTAPLAGRAQRPLPGWAVPALVAAGAGLAIVAWGAWIGLGRPELPDRRFVALLAPTAVDPADDRACFALGAVEVLGTRLARHQNQPGFQMASFQEGFDEKAESADDARRILGANLALVPAVEQRSDAFRARLVLWDAARGRIVGSRTIETPVSRPLAFLDRLYRESATVLRLEPDGRDAAAEYGVRGAGTLRFLLQGIGRLRAAKTDAQAGRAVEDLEVACRTEPDAAVPRVWLAAAQLRLHALTGDRAVLAAAETRAREAIALDSTRAESHRMLGVVLDRQKNRPEARASLARATEIDPTMDDAWLLLGRVHARLGQPERERETYLAVMERRPHAWPPYWWLATWHFREGHVEDAIRAYRQMIARAPDLHKGYSSLGGLLVLRGDYDAAIDTLRRAVALRPTKVAYDNLGTAFFNSGRLDQAIEAYNQSFQFGQASYGTWLNLGDAYFWLRDRRDQAMEAYEQAVRLGREEILSRDQRGLSPDVMIFADLATVFPKLGHPDSADVYLGRALGTDSTNSMVQYCAALTCWQLQRKPQAIAWLQRAVRGGYPTAWIRDSPIFAEWRGEEALRALVTGRVPTASQAASHSGGGRR